MFGERLGVIIKGGIYGDSRFKEEYSSSFINRWSGWLGQNDIFEKRKSSWEISRATKKAETKLRDLSEQAQGTAPLPEVIESQPLKDLSPSQTKSQPLLYFIIYEAKKSIYKYNDVEMARWSGVLTEQARKSP